MTENDKLIQPWRHVSSRVLLAHRRFTIVEDQVVLPTGQQIDWWCFANPRDFVAVICLDAAGRVLISYQYNHPPRRVVDELPGGIIDPGESVVDAARRELLEEVGVYAGQIRELGSFLPNNRRSSGRCHMVLATELEQRQATPEETEFIATEWVEPAALEERIRTGQIENILVLAAWGLLRALGLLDQLSK